MRDTMADQRHNCPSASCCCETSVIALRATFEGDATPLSHATAQPRCRLLPASLAIPPPYLRAWPLLRLLVRDPRRGLCQLQAQTQGFSVTARSWFWTSSARTEPDRWAMNRMLCSCWLCYVWLAIINHPRGRPCLSPITWLRCVFGHWCLHPGSGHPLMHQKRPRQPDISS